MTKKSRRLILALASDEHGGHVLGLCNPDVKVSRETADRRIEKYTPRLTAAQEWEWEVRLWAVKGIVELAGRDEIVVIDHGDPVQGNGFARELVSTRPSDQFEIAYMNKIPLMRLPNVKRALFVRGTGTHEFQEGSAQAIIAARIEAETKKKVEVVYHAEAIVDGLRLDLAHHGAPPGSRNWLRGNILRLYAQSIMDESIASGEAPPDFIGRGHYHQFTTEVVTRRALGKTWQTRATILPAFCLVDDYARKVVKSPWRASVGMLALEIIDGRIIEQHEFLKSIDFRTRIEL
jgi:hypothetical protein